MMPGEVRRYREKTSPAVCRHCGKQGLFTGRRLCWTCRRAPEIRAKYPSRSKYARLGVGYANATPPPPRLPTAYPPGTVGKLYVMMARATRGEHIHHPDDPKI